MKRGILLSDLHTGSNYGMWPPGMKEEDPQTGDLKPLHQNSINAAIWQHWQKLLAYIRKEPPDFVLWNADLVDGTQNREYGRGLITRSIDLQQHACINIIQTVRKAAPKAAFYFTAGTGYHQNSDGENVEKAIARHFSAEFGNELVIEECGIRIFARHMISSSMSTWQYMATAPGRDHMLLYLNKSPEKYGAIDVAVFSHRHQFVCVQFSSGIALVTPCWQSKTPYSSVRKGLVGVPEIGWVTLHIDHPKKITVDTSGIATVVKPCKVVGRDHK